MDKPLIDHDIIREMLYNDESFIEEFSDASIESFTEFKNEFHNHLINSDMDQLRRAGHKIKPVAQMLHLDQLLEMYEESKNLIEENSSQKEKEELAEKMDEYCNQIVSEFQ